MRKVALLLCLIALADASPHRRYGRQNQPDPHRTVQIQSALIRLGYLHSSSGKWDSSTKEALQRLQHDHGWQTKKVPDARAIIFLGLGPDYSNALKSPDPN